jgi:hypothetical protein
VLPDFHEDHAIGGKYTIVVQVFEMGWALETFSLKKPGILITSRTITENIAEQVVQSL